MRQTGRLRPPVGKPEGCSLQLCAEPEELSAKREVEVVDVRWTCTGGAQALESLVTLLFARPGSETVRRSTRWCPRSHLDRSVVGRSLSPRKPHCRIERNARSLYQSWVSSVSHGAGHHLGPGFTAIAAAGAAVSRLCSPLCHC